MNNKSVYTVITGASMGLGKCMAVECARKNRNLILIALPDESIHKTAIELSERYGVKVECYETDLTLEEHIDSLTTWINKHFEIDMLINNAGTGGTKNFDNATIQYMNNIIQLNMKALVYLTHQLLPLLKQQPTSYILNIASLAAFGPMPFKTIYPASKAFVSSFSRGLNAELLHTGVSVSVAYPGAMATNPEISRRMSKHSSIVKSTYLSPQKTAQRCIRKTLAGKVIIVPGFANKMSRLFIQLMPEELLLYILSRNFKKEIQPTIAS